MSSGTTVHGILCSRGHMNDPKARFCAVCGISMVHQTHNLVSGPRPPLGVIVLDDGSSFSLDHDYVIGRDPESSDLVQRGQARPLLIVDPTSQMSRVHARILLREWGSMYRGCWLSQRHSHIASECRRVDSTRSVRADSNHARNENLGSATVSWYSIRTSPPIYGWEDGDPDHMLRVRARSRLTAALISARCVKAWGKFPSASPADPICSE